jgi:hypothetical protein
MNAHPQQQVQLLVNNMRTDGLTHSPSAVRLRNSPSKSGLKPEQKQKVMNISMEVQKVGASNPNDGKLQQQISFV